MSETTSTTQNGIVDTADEEMEEFLAFKAAKAAAAKRAEDAKAARIRANNRPVDKNGNEKPASLAYVHRLADLLESWSTVYANDPPKLASRLAELTPRIREMGNTDRTLAGVTFDAERRGMQAMFPPDNATPVPSPSKK